MEQLILHLIGDYLTQSDWMAQNKTKNDTAATVHAIVYSLPFLALTGISQHGLAAWIIILSTHFAIDRYRLARYVVWAKNLIGPKGWCYSEWLGQEQRSAPKRYWPWRDCTEFGCTPDRAKVPAFMGMWLLIIADNTLHLAINYAALRWL